MNKEEVILVIFSLLSCVKKHKMGCKNKKASEILGIAQDFARNILSFLQSILLYLYV